MSAPRPTSVIVDGHELNGVDDLGVQWKFISSRGWREGAGTEVPQNQRVVSHGQFGEPGHRTGKMITIVGMIEVTERSLMPGALDRLAGILADGQFGIFHFTDRTQGERHTRVQLLDAPDTIWSGGVTATYQMVLLAPDTYRYGATSSASTGFGSTPVGSGLVFPLFPTPGSLDFGVQGTTGSVTVSNAGSAPATVKFTVTGPTPAGGFTITNSSTGAMVRYLGAVPTGSSLVIDGSDGSVVIDGVADRLGDTVVEAWPTVAKGSSTDFLFASLGGPTASVMTAQVVSTYW